MPSDLSCPNCETVYDAAPNEPWRCRCGRALEFLEQPIPDSEFLERSSSDQASGGESSGDTIDGSARGTTDGSALGVDDRSALGADDGLWAFSEFLPIEKRVSLHEGFTPLVSAPEWNASFKLEYVFPTGSFKDRGATATLSRAAELGVETVIEDSSGNAGAAIATYAARAGIEAEIYVPADVKRSKLRAIERVGARPVQIEGARADVTAACLEAVESDAEAWYASHAWNPAFYAGTMTFAFEVAAQRGWEVPDAVVLPIGHGTLFLGAYRGFARLLEAGITDEIPRLLGVQATSHAPIVRRLKEEMERGVVTGDADSAQSTIDDGKTTVADGIQIAEPAREDELLEAIEASDGDAIALENEPIEAALERLHRSGFYVEPTSAIAPAALSRYRERGVVRATDDVVVPLTGSGLKIS